MTDCLSPKQRLILFKLLFTGEKPQQSKVKPDLTPTERAQLEKLGLITLDPDPKSRAKLIVLTDAAWRWAGENLDSELSLSAQAAPALEGVLRKMKTFLAARSLKLSDFLATANGASTTQPARDDIPSRIREACLAISNGRYRHPVRLAELRPVLHDVSRKALDATLLEMQQRGALSLQTIEDPRQLSQADHRGAVHVLAAERHLVYLEK
jgi:hypothetical protein